MKLRAAREALGKTKKQVAKEANVTERTYSYYEAGEMKPSVDKALDIAYAVNSTVEAIWGT